MTTVQEPTTPDEEAWEASEYITTKPTIDVAEDPIGAVFEQLGLLTIAEAIAHPERLLELSDDRLEAYAKMAAVRWSGVACPVDGRTWEDFADSWTIMLMQAFDCAGTNSDIGPVIDEEGRECCEFGSRGGEKMPLTEASLQHWQWLSGLLRDEETARTFLAAVPAYARKAGDDQASKVVGDTFGAMVGVQS